jgi:hypothetical protein
MNWFKRIELWLLLALVLAGLFFVFAHKATEDEANKSGDVVVPSDKDDAPVKLHRSMITRDYGNARLDIDLRVRNDGAEKLVLQTPKARLLNGKGREIPSFFLPFDALPEVPPRSTQDVQLRYWLEAADFQGAITLEVNGKSMTVKSTKPFDLNMMKNAEKKTMTSTEW